MHYAACGDLLAVLNATITAGPNMQDKQSLMAAADRNATLSDTDPSGAVKFTVAVVLLYGVGVIGLLGITARRNRRVELMDKEVNKFLKMQHQSHTFERKTKRKRKIKTVNKLIAALHFQDKINESELVSPVKRFKNCNNQTSRADDAATSITYHGMNKTASVATVNETESGHDSVENYLNSMSSPQFTARAYIQPTVQVSLLFSTVDIDNRC